MIKCRMLRISILIFFVLLILSSKVFASGLGDWLNEAEDFITDGGNEAITSKETMNTVALKDGSNIIYNAFFVIGVGVAIIVGAIMGIQFMTAGIDKKVEVKQALYPYIISCVVLFGAFGIWKLIITIMNEIA